jgi:hypothetical protein
VSPAAAHAPAAPHPNAPHPNAPHPNAPHPNAPHPNAPRVAPPRPPADIWAGAKSLEEHLAEMMDPNRQMVVDAAGAIQPSSSAPTAASIPQLDGGPRPPSVGELQVVSGSCVGKRIRMDFRRFVVGHERDCDLRPPVSPLLSRHHCVFKRDEYAVRVRDLGSNTGTYVNGRRIQHEAILKPGDDVRVGDLTLHVVLPAAPRVTEMQDSHPSISDFVIL